MSTNKFAPLVVVCALFMENIDGSVISTSLPAISADLDCSVTSLKLALTSYLLSVAIFIPVSGWAADRFGARTIFQVAIGVFTIGSILCGLSSTLSELVGARIIQGAGGAMMVPVGRLVLVRSVPREDLVVSMAYLSVPALVGPIIGPPLGGLITTYYQWSLIFWINIPFGIIGLIFSALFMENFRNNDGWPLDIRGFILSGSGLSLSICGFNIIGHDYSSIILALFMTTSGLVLIVFYVFHAKYFPYPLIDLSLLSIPSFRASVLGGFLFRLGIGALPFLLPLMLQIGFGFTAFQSGCIILVRTVGIIIAKFAAKSIICLFYFKSILVNNAILSSITIFLYAFFDSDTSFIIIFVTLLFGGIFRSLEFAALNALTYADIKPDSMGMATSFSSVVQQLSLSMGVAAGAGIIDASKWLHQDLTLRSNDFSNAFIFVAMLSSTSAIIFAKLPSDAGENLRPISRRKIPGSS